MLSDRSWYNPREDARPDEDERPTLHHYSATSIPLNGSNILEPLFSLKVILKRAERLAKREFFSSKSDLYCKLYLDDKQQRQTSSIKIQTLFPSWNELFNFENVNVNQTLYLKIFDQNLVWKDTFLGMAVLSLRHYIPSLNEFWNHSQLSISKTVIKELSGRPHKQDYVSGCVTLKLIFSPIVDLESFLSILPQRNDQNIPISPSVAALHRDELEEVWEERSDGMSRLHVHQPTRAVHWEEPLAVDIMAQRPLFHPLLDDVNSLCSDMSTTFPYQEQEGLPPLPVGWEVRCMSEGQVFFVDHHRRKTQWEDPRTGKLYSDSLTLLKQSVAITGPLPAGWIERRTTNGHVYYVDNIQRRTQWDGKWCGFMIKIKRSLFFFFLSGF
jgi:hypothetical protein